MKLSNQDIIKGIENGDRNILNYVYNEYRQKVIIIINESGGTDNEAKDIFQTVLIRIFHMLKTKNIDISNIGAYILKASINEYYNSDKYFRTKQYKDIDLDQIEEMTFEEDIQYIRDDEGDEIVRFLKIFNLLPEDCQKIFRFKAQNIAYKDMVPLMNKQNENALRLRKKRCVEMFHKLYNN